MAQGGALSPNSAILPRGTLREVGPARSIPDPAGNAAAMTPTKLLIGQILIVFAIVIAGLWVATQWAAAMLAYQPELGRPWGRSPAATRRGG